jgi:GINS complex subunit 3
MNQSYWDLSSILADSVRLPCHFTIDVPGLSHIVGTNQATSAATTTSSSSNTTAKKRGGGVGNDLTVEKKSRVDLPFWLAEILALHNVVDLSFPRQYSARVRSALDAQAKSVRLRDLSGWWYAIGVRLSAL